MVNSNLSMHSQAGAWERGEEVEGLLEVERLW